MRKRLIIVNLFLGYFFAGFGQTNVYHPFPDSNAVWTQVFSSYWGADCGGQNPLIRDDHFSYTMQSNTVIAGNTYRKIYSSGYSHEHCVMTNTYNIYTPYPTIYVGAIRQDVGLKKVFFIETGMTEKLLYDFSSVAGSTLAVAPSANDGACTVTVTLVDSILIGSSYRKRFNLSTNNYSIIEGIGSTGGLLESICEPFENWGALQCFIQNNKTLYPDTINACQIMTRINEVNKFPKFSISPNPSSGIFNITGLQNEYAFEIYDINGRSIYKKYLNENKIIDISQNNKGIYYYKISDAQGNSSHGILVLE